MFQKCLSSTLILSFLFSLPTFGKELYLVKDKTYLLMYDEEIENLNYNKDCMTVEVVHTIFNDKKQLILTLNKNCRSFLQVNTSGEMYTYEIINSRTASKDLIEIDIPPIENLDVDIYTGGEN